MNPHSTHFEPSFSTNSILVFHLRLDTAHEPHTSLFEGFPLFLARDSLTVNSFSQCLHFDIDCSFPPLGGCANLFIRQVPPAGLEPATYRLTYHFGLHRPYGSWSGLYLHPFWMPAVKSLHLPFRAWLGIGSNDRPPNLTGFRYRIPAKLLLLFKVGYSTN